MDMLRGLLGGLGQMIPGVAEFGAAAGIESDTAGAWSADEDEDEDADAESSYTRYLAGGPRTLGINDR
jgi:hypothetical protein